MRNCIILVLLSALALLAPVQTASAQSQEWGPQFLVSGMPQDGRYAHFTYERFRVRVTWPTAPPASVAGSRVYTPSYYNLKKVALPGTHEVPLETDAWVWMLGADDRMDWRWQSAGTIFLFNSDNQPVARADCHNPAPVIVYLRAPEPPPVAVTPPPERVIIREVPVEVKIPCPTCPVDGVVIDTYATKGARFWGGLWQTALSVGVGVGSSGAFSDSGQRGRGMWQSALASGISGRVAQFFNPSDNRARILVSANGGNQTYELKKGQSIQGLPGGGVAEWHGDQITVTIPLCGVWSASPHTGFNFTPVPIIRQNVFQDRVVKNPRTPPVKTYPGPPGPGIPGTTAPKASSRRISAAWQ